MELKMNKQLSILSAVAFGSVLIVLLSISVEPVTSRPSVSNGWSEFHATYGVRDPKRLMSNSYECENTSREVRELCQRCAKVTKSKLAYPMCCDSRENAREWCRELLMIG